jgi:hypothetical protein
VYLAIRAACRIGRSLPDEASLACLRKLGVINAIESVADGMSVGAILDALDSIVQYKLADRDPLYRDSRELLAHRELFDSGRMDPRPPIIIIDDFYKDPHAVRTLALECRYRRYPRAPNWMCSAGGAAAADHFQFRTAAIRCRIEEVCGALTDLGWESNEWNGAFHYKTAEPLGLSSSIHTHEPEDIFYGFNGILYLNVPGTYPDGNGVSIWRDRRTGRCVAHRKTFEIGLHNFELCLRIENRFNRCVLIRSDVWHLGETGFGSSVENARLFQTFFFDVPQARAGARVAVSW